MTKNILVTGSIAYDYIMNFNDQFKNHIMPDKMHVLSVSFVADKLNKQFGGTAPNISYTLKLLEENPTIFGVAGSDFNEYKLWLEQNNISTENIKILEDLTAQAHIITDKDDNQISAFYGGAMFKNELTLNQTLIENSFDFAIISPETSTAMTRHANTLHENNIKFIFDPGQNIPLFSKEDLIQVINQAHILIVNDYELSLVEKTTELSLDKLKEILDHVIVTLGPKGSIVHTKDKSVEVGVATPEEILDPTGAGDAFRAGLITGLVNSLPIETAAKIGATSAAYTVEKYGTQTHSFKKEEFAKRYQENFKEEYPLNN